MRANVKEISDSWKTLPNFSGPFPRLGLWFHAYSNIVGQDGFYDGAGGFFEILIRLRQVEPLFQNRMNDEVFMIAAQCGLVLSFGWKKQAMPGLLAAGSQDQYESAIQVTAFTPEHRPFDIRGFFC